MKNIRKNIAAVLAVLMCTSLAGCAEGNTDGVQAISAAKDSVYSEVNETVPKPAEPVTPKYTAEEISGYFDYALLKETVTEENTAISPMSVRLALSMAAMGAKNDTEKELLTLLGYENAEQMREYGKSVISELNREDGSITVNNSVWADKDYQIGEKYTADLADVFGAEAFREKLSDKKIIDSLNVWIDEKTKGLIPQMISEPFGADTVLLLVNALYFKNEWVQEFEPFPEGFPLIFHGVNGDSETAGMYLNYADIDYGENGAFRSVSLEYKDGSRMNIYLPKSETENVLDIIADSSPDVLAENMDIKYEKKLVNIQMPKFECDYSNSLKETLQRLGMTVSFDSEAADFGGMLDMESSDELYISNVIHAAKLKCNEKGTEAAAATIDGITGCALPAEVPVNFIADRPFIYEIKDPNSERLFMGTVCNF